MLSFLAAQYGTVSDIEIVWTVIAFIGLCFSVHNLVQAVGDLEVLRANNISNGRLILAKFTIKAEAARSIMQLIFFLIGVGAMTLVDPPNQLNLPIRVVLITALFRWGLVIAAGLVTLKSYWAWQVRRELIYDRSHREEDHAHTDLSADQINVSGEHVEITESSDEEPESS